MSAGQSVERIRHSLSLAGFAEQVRWRVAVPGMRQVRTWRGSHINVCLTVLAHYLVRSAKDPDKQRTLGPPGHFLHCVRHDFQTFRREFHTDQVATGEQGVAI